MRVKSVLLCFFALLTSIFHWQCRSINNHTSQKNSYKGIYIDQFKLTYFRKLFIKAYNNSQAAQEIIYLDHSGFVEPILTMDDYRFIDSLAIADNEKLKTDSANGDQRAEGAQGKRPLQFILDKHKSKWLDSIAKMRYKNSGRTFLW